ncbi:anthranilate synthase component I [Roseofilum casamattae]|uniref:Anthranilate synthase component 1 n=1 Tax=Roseofilum casamattae BLCC-M143 TaxID=3022442 RepID=A0ABT7BU77_9CYAN|nr:anthranilate synthase component I [Roseofilum casamattae]MDJ1182074.1 anthranilate synthase component I [Roseofilum casamattae BLCC-M143]
MIYPDFPQFKRLARQGNFIPVYQEWVADLETPVSAWYKVCADRPYSFLLESVEGGETIGRYSFLGCDPLWILEAKGDRTTQTFRDGTRQDVQGDPLAQLAACLEPYHPVKLPNLPPGIGGLFGFWGYELIQWIEDTVPVHEGDESDLPDGLWMQVDHLLVFDQVKRKIWAIAYVDARDPKTKLKKAYKKARACIKSMVKKLNKPISRKHMALEWTPPNRLSTDSTLKYTSNITPETFCANVKAAQDYIRAGDIFQVVLSQRLDTPYKGKPFDLYRSLRLINPSPYMAFFNFGTWQLIGSSPEVMVKADKDANGNIKATVRPIAGTRRRGKTEEEDRGLEIDLLQDPKEIAEHVMLVDLGRNDLGRVCQSGTVTVDRLMVIERYSHVMHIVSNVVGQLKSDRAAWDLLKACFPAGTVSGAPKIRAMEIIHELEGCRRGPYSGVYGYYDFEGQLNSAITIRTAIVRNNLVSVQAGAGLVADSVPEKEYEETLNKAKGLLLAIECLHGVRQ